MSNLPQRRTGAAPHTQRPARGGRLQTHADPSHAERLQSRFAGQIEELEASEVYPHLVGAVQDLVTIMDVPATDGQVLAVCLRLYANGCTAYQAHLIGRVLMDDAEFVRGVKRYSTPIMSADWVEVLRRLPTKGGRYTAEQVADFQRLGFPDQAFPRMTGADVGAPFGYVDPSTPAGEVRRG